MLPRLGIAIDNDIKRVGNAVMLRGRRRCDGPLLDQTSHSAEIMVTQRFISVYKAQLFPDRPLSVPDTCHTHTYASAIPRSLFFDCIGTKAAAGSAKDPDCEQLS